MRTRGNGDNNNALATINAAATVISSGENLVPHASSQKKRWRSCWSVYWCFGYHRHRKRIGHVASETSSNRNEAPVSENSIQASAISLPFVAPPSSPASFLQSEPPSAAQSPAGMVSLTSISASMYSPSGPASIFAVGPYAHETQLVSPPVFSAFTTEPSTAPFTPPESVHLTTPSSPEVPFAQLLDPDFRSGDVSQRYPYYNYEFHCYQLHPGSPIGQLISPSSGISGSGTSSPFPDGEFATGGPHFLEFRTGNPPKLLNLDKLSKREWGSRQGSGSLTPDSTRPTSSRFPLDRQFSDVASHSNSDNGYQSNQVVGCRVSVDLTAENVLRCVEQKCQSLENKTMVERMTSSNEPTEGSISPDGKTSDGTQEETMHVEVPRHQKQQSITFAPTRDFNLGNNDEDAPKLKWWANRHDSESQNGELSNGILETTLVNVPHHQKQESFALAPIRDTNLDNDDEDAPKPNWWANTRNSESQNGEISNGTAETTHVDTPRHQKQESFALAPIRDFNFDNDDKDVPRLNWWANGNGSESQDGENCTVTPKATNVEMPCHQRQHSITLSPVGDCNIDNDDEDDAPRPNWWASGGVVRNDVAKNWSFFPMMQPGVS